MVDCSGVIWIADDEFVSAELRDVVLRGRDSFVIKNDYLTLRDVLISALFWKANVTVVKPENIPAIPIQR